MAKYFIEPFATAGDRIAVPDDVQPDGSVSYAQGYGIDYSLDPTVDPNAKQIERTKMNDLFYQVTLALQQYQQHAFPDYITTVDNGGVAYEYSKYDMVRYDPGGGARVYQSLVDNNDQLPTVTANWAEVVLGGSSNLIYTGGTTTDSANAQAVTPLSPNGFSLVDGTAVVCKFGYTNNGPMSLNAGGTGALTVKKNTPTGLQNLSGNEAIAGNIGLFIYNAAASVWVLESGAPALLPSNNLSDLTSVATAIANLGFGQSFGSSGWCVLPNGVIFQWGGGAVTGTGSQSATISFPTSFLVACYQVVCSDSGASCFPWGTSNYTTSGFTAWKIAWLGSGASTNVQTSSGSFHYYAVGR